MKAIRWGIVGCGDVTEVKSGPGFQKISRSELVAVMRRNGDLDKDSAFRHNVPYWYDISDSLINNPAVDSVHIVTPPSIHKKYALDVLNAGKPVYIEKSIAISFSNVRKYWKLAKKIDIPIFTAYCRRALPKFLKVKSIIELGLIGEIRAVNMRLYKNFADGKHQAVNNWRIDPRIVGAGYIIDLGTHILI